MTVINTNVKSLIAQASLAANNKNLSTAMERLSTGSRINSSKDDAAGLAISSRMTSQVRGLNMAIRNANDGISLAQTAEGAMEETTSMLQRMRELSLQAANSVNNASDRAALDAEVQQLKAEIDRIAGTTTFNNQNILDGSFSGVLQIGDKASQTMAFAVGAVTTTAMGATAQGEAVGNSLASLTVGGASRVAGDYQGLSFNVAVDGVARTVTLPVPTSSVSNVSGANAAVTPTAADRTVDLSSSAQIGSVLQNTVDLGTDTEDGKLLIAINGGSNQIIDISSPSYYVDEDTATGAEIVTALQTELDANIAFQGANALTVSLTSNGLLRIGMADGSDTLITISDDDNGTVNTFLSGALGLTADSVISSKGAVTLGALEQDFSANSSFQIDGNHYDLRAAITANGFDASALTGEQFVRVYNETAVLAGQSVSSVSISGDGLLTFSGGIPESPDVNWSLANGDASTGLAIATGETTSTYYLDAYPAAASVLAENSVIITASTNDTLTITLGDNSAVDLTLGADTYVTMADLAAEIQGKIDASGAFVGDNAILVTATVNSENGMGLTFSNVAGQSMVVDGTFMTANDDGAGSISGGLQAASASMGDSTVVSGDVSVSSEVATIASSTTPVTVGNTLFTTRTYDLNATPTFSADVNGQGAIDLDLTAAIAALELDDTALSGEDLVAALNYTFEASGSFVGNNAVTASITSSGHLQLAVAGGPASGGNPSLVLDEDSVSAAGWVEALQNLGFDSTGTQVTGAADNLTSDSSGVLVVRSATTNLEQFGFTDLEIDAATDGNETLIITVGDGNPVNLTLADGVYSDAADLVEQIQTQIAALEVFQGNSALTFTVSTNADGEHGFSVTSATGEAVELDGTLLTDAQGFNLTDPVTFPGVVAPTGGVDLSVDSSVTMSVTDSAGSVFTQSFTLAGSDANTSFADYASLVQTAANTAFEASGFTFTASYSDGQFSLTVDQADASGVTLSGSSVDAIFGEDVVGSAPVVEVAASRFGSMADVAAAINNDLDDAAVANFDTATNTWSFTATSGLAGTGSTIALSGEQLANVQIGGTLSATGEAGNATASRLSDISITTVDDANAAIASIDNAIEYVNSQRAYLGAIQNRLDHTVSNLTNIATNTEASRSRIMDADYGAESANLAKAQIIQQAATAMLAQANQSAQSVLSLLQ